MNSKELDIVIDVVGDAAIENPKDSVKLWDIVSKLEDMREEAAWREM